MAHGLLPIAIEKSDEKITASSGILLFTEALHALGIIEGFRAFPRPLSNRGINAKHFLQAVMTTLADGGQTFEDVQRLFNDKVLVHLTSLKPFDSSTLEKWLKRNSRHKYQLLHKIYRRLVKHLITQAEEKRFTLDLDAMAIETSKSTAEKTYKGFRGYMPLLGFIPELGINCFQKFQTGNTSPQTGLLEATKDSLHLIPKGKQLSHLRSDSAGYQSELINFCEENNIIFTITADFDSSVRETIAHIPETDWLPLTDEFGSPTDRQYASTIHSMHKTNNAFRLIVQRSCDNQLRGFRV
jgi:hypothetical protein